MRFKLLLFTIFIALTVIQSAGTEEPTEKIKSFDIKTEFNEQNANLDFAHVSAAKGSPGKSGWNISVTIRHNDSGWDHYADIWQIIDPESREVLAKRILHHPHVNEQPFTRSQANIKLPANQKSILIQAGCTKHGFGGQEILLFLTLTEDRQVEYQVITGE